MSVGVGDRAPDFSLAGTGGAHLQPRRLPGRPLVLVFYPGDDTPVCTKQLNTYNDDLSEFEALDAQVVGISSQDVASHEQFADKHGFGFPLLADTDKTVAAAYGTLGPIGFPRRSIFIIDADGVIRYAHRALAGLTYRPVSELLGRSNNWNDPGAAASGRLHCEPVFVDPPDPARDRRSRSAFRVLGIDPGSPGAASPCSTLAATVRRSRCRWA
jgi:thioredoxin-dependent peroxiredoxin